MKTFEIVKYPEKILKRKAGKITATPELKLLIPQMIDAMYEADGIGLAAPQIGISKQIIIVETSENPREHKHERKQGVPGKPLAFLNPVIIGKSKEADTEEEGCLSLPGVFVPVKRAHNIKLECQTADGEQMTIEAAGLIARIFQHEVDHLNGKLIIDHIHPVKRFKLRGQLREMQRTHK